MFKKRKEEKIEIVVATRDPQALAALEQAPADLPLARREALSTDGAYRALPGAHLAIVDLKDLVESGGVGRERLTQVLAVLGGGDVVTVTGEQFAADPARYLDQARAASGLAQALPARSVALTGLSGGVGKTTLALSLARHFRKRTGLPVAVAELALGPSSLQALVGTGEEMAHLYEVATQGKQWPVWEGITLAPMDWPTARLLQPEDAARAWHALRESHVLTVFDGAAFHPLWATVAHGLVDEAYAVSDSRPDALVSAVYFAGQEDGVPARVLLNRGGVTARLAMEHPPAASLPDAGRAADGFPARLGQPLMRLVYPGWRQ
jgi:hypothetical protein